MIQTLEEKLEQKGKLRERDWAVYAVEETLEVPGQEQKRRRPRACNNWPLLSICIRNRKRCNWRRKPLRIRMIKVRMDGPVGGRWVNYAHWWWEQNRGPVPESQRVIHADGDSLNDDPGNLILGTPGDVIFLCHDRDPKMSQKNFAKLRAVTAERNRQTGEINRAMNWLPTHWYAVDLDNRQIINQPRRNAWEAYADLGMEVSALPTRRPTSVVLGWPDCPELMALALSALAARGELTRVALADEIAAMRERQGWPGGRPTVGAMAQAKVQLAAGWIICKRRRGQSSSWAITEVALAARKAHTRLVLRRGREFDQPPFVHFEKVAAAVGDAEGGAKVKELSCI